MQPIPQSKNQRAFVTKIALLLPWAAAIYAALAITQLQGDWGHSICGTWGCGPPTQALIGCHLAWATLLFPIAWMFCGAKTPSQKVKQRIAWALVAFAFATFFTITIYQRMTWFSAASEFQRPYFWHRVGFVLITNVEIPTLQLFLSGWLILIRLKRTKKSALPPSELESRIEISD